MTTVARTLLDLAGVLRPRQLERALDEAERQQLFDLRAIERLRERSPRRRGSAALDRLLAHHRGPAPTRSELERQFLGLCRDANLPPPSINALAAGIEVDAVWHDRWLVVEMER